MNPLDKDIYELNQDKKRLQSLERLLTNPDFKLAIMDDFLVRHSLKLVKSKGKLGIDPQTNLDIDRQLDSVALFGMWLDRRISDLQSIDKEIMEAEALRDQQTQGINQ